MKQNHNLCVSVILTTILMNKLVVKTIANYDMLAIAE